jgi:hypothetical protein
VILALGLATGPWHGITLWGEVGQSLQYLKGSLLPDYRGGVSVARGIGHPLRAEAPGWFSDLTLDGVFISRFGNDFLVYEQARAGYTRGPAQLYWNLNLTADVHSQSWANFVETGPGVRFSHALMPKSSFLTFDVLRGTYLIDRGNFTDIRGGVWYAFSH